MLNCDGPAPIEVPMHSAPLSVDLDGDGEVDVLEGSQYSNTIGMPWDGIFFFRNIGSNEKPFFDRPLRLHARGVEHELRWYSKTPVTDESGFISEYYLRFNLFDWFGTGRLDVITISLADEYIKIYRNTGVRDHNGLPVLELAQKIPQPKCVKHTGYPGIRILDWFGDGRPTLIVSCTGDAVFISQCTSPAGEEPRFDDPPRRLLLENGDPVAGNWSFDLCDWTGEGRRDLIMEDLNLPFPCLLYQNTGTPQKPVYRDRGAIGSIPVRRVSDPPLDGGRGVLWTAHRRRRLLRAVLGADRSGCGGSGSVCGSRAYDGASSAGFLRGFFQSGGVRRGRGRRLGSTDRERDGICPPL